MVQNLQQQIETDIEKTMSVFLSNGSKWNKSGDTFIKSKDGKYILSFFPELLTYTDPKNSSPWVANLWIGCRFSIENRESDHEEQCKEFLRYVDNLMLKPFHDDVAYCQKFSVKKSTEWTDYICYFNPDFPQGKSSSYVI